MASLVEIEITLESINGMDAVIQREEETAVTEFPSLLKLLTKKTKLFGNASQSRTGLGGTKSWPRDLPPYRKERRNTEETS